MDEMQTPQKQKEVEEASPKRKSYLLVLIAFVVMAITLIIGLLIGYAVGLSASKSEDEISLSKDNFEYIEYDYDEPSLPPKYRQSFSIRIEKDTISIKPKYSDDVPDWKSFTLTENDINEILNAVKNIDFNKKYSEDIGCTGGVTKALTLKTKTSEFKVDIYVCSITSANETLELDAAISVITSKVPDSEKGLMRD